MENGAATETLKTEAEKATKSAKWQETMNKKQQPAEKAAVKPKAERKVKESAAKEAIVYKDNFQEDEKKDYSECSRMPTVRSGSCLVQQVGKGWILQAEVCIRARRTTPSL